MVLFQYIVGVPIRWLLHNGCRHPFRGKDNTARARWNKNVYVKHCKTTYLLDILIFIWQCPMWHTWSHTYSNIPGSKFLFDVVAVWIHKIYNASYQWQLRFGLEYPSIISEQITVWWIARNHISLLNYNYDTMSHKEMFGPRLSSCTR